MVEKAKGGLGNLFNRPKTEFIDQVGQEFAIDCQPSDLVFFRKCEKCKVSLKKKAAKLIVDTCSDLEIELEESLMSGTMECVDSEKVIVRINPQHPLPTLTAERCHDFQLYLHESSATGSIYTISCSNFKVLLQESDQESTLDLPSDDCQYVTKYVDKKFRTSRVVREGGGYAISEEELKEAKEREAQNEKAMEAYLRQLITFTRSGGGGGKVDSHMVDALAAALDSAGTKDKGETKKKEGEKKEKEDGK